MTVPSIPPPFRVLVSGAGSIGRRHLRNMRSLGMSRLAVADPGEPQRRQAREETGCAASADFEEMLREERPDIVFICSPTKHHVSQALRAARAGAHLFIEKPLSHTREGIGDLMREVRERNLTCMVGCNMRFHHGPATVKRLLREGRIGSVRRAEICTASFLPHWRPAQDYHESYSADPEQGGAILDCIHEIDLALWYLGPATLLRARTEPATPIGLAVEGSADLVLQHASGAVSTVHLSFMEREYQRLCIIEGTEGSVTWDIREKKVGIRDSGGNVTAVFEEPPGYDLNRMYGDELEHFFSCIAQKRLPFGNLEEARQALDLALGARMEG